MSTAESATAAVEAISLALADYRQQIEAALSYADATHTYDDVASMVAAGAAQFWPGPASVLITEIIEFPRKRVLNVFLAGGNLPELEAMIPLALEWGTSQGCASATFVGRRGWTRTFVERMGWTDSRMVLMSKPL